MNPYLLKHQPPSRPTPSMQYQEAIPPIHAPPPSSLSSSSTNIDDILSLLEQTSWWRAITNDAPDPLSPLQLRASHHQPHNVIRRLQQLLQGLIAMSCNSNDNDPSSSSSSSVPSASSASSAHSGWTIARVVRFTKWMLSQALAYPEETVGTAVPALGHQYEDSRRTYYRDMSNTIRMILFSTFTKLIQHCWHANDPILVYAAAITTTTHPNDNSHTGRIPVSSSPPPFDQCTTTTPTTILTLLHRAIVSDMHPTSSSCTTTSMLSCTSMMTYAALWSALEDIQDHSYCCAIRSSSSGTTSTSTSFGYGTSPNHGDDTDDRQPLPDPQPAGWLQDIYRNNHDGGWQFLLHMAHYGVTLLSLDEWQEFVSMCTSVGIDDTNNNNISAATATTHTRSGSSSSNNRDHCISDYSLVQYKASCAYILSHILQNPPPDTHHHPHPSQYLLSLSNHDPNSTEHWIQSVLVHESHCLNGACVVDHHNNNNNSPLSLLRDDDDNYCRHRNNAHPGGGDDGDHDVYFSLRCFELLIVIQQQQQRQVSMDKMAGLTSLRDDIQSFLENTYMVSNLIMAMLGGGCDNRSDMNDNCEPSTRQQQQQPATRTYASGSSDKLQQVSLSILRLLYTLFPNTISKRVGLLENDVSNRIQRYVQHLWEILLRKHIPNSSSSQQPETYSIQMISNHQLDCIHFLHELDRVRIRKIILSSVKDCTTATTTTTQQVSSSLQNACINLLNWTWSSNSLSAGSYVQLLCMDQGDTILHDELSRMIWQHVPRHNTRILPKFAGTTTTDTTGRRSSIDQYQEPSIFEYCWNLIQTMLIQQQQQESTPHNISRNDTPNATVSNVCRRPIVLKLLDIMYILLKGNGPDISNIVTSWSAQSLDSFIYILSDKFVQVSTNCDTEESTRATTIHFGLHDEDYTPTVQNLSRCYDGPNGVQHGLSSSPQLLPSSHATNDEQANPRVSVPTMGWWYDCCIQLGIATIFAVLGNDNTLYGSNADELLEHQDRIRYIRRRILDATNSYVVRVHIGTVYLGHAACDGNLLGDDMKMFLAPLISFDMTQRRLRLLMSLGQPDNEEYLSDLLYISERTQRSKYIDLHERLIECNAQLKKHREREEELVSENGSYRARLSAQSTMFQYEKNELRRHITQKANELVEVHVSERKKAEQSAQQLSQSLTEAQGSAQKYHEAERQVRSVLDDTTNQLKAVTGREQEFSARVRQYELEIQHTSDELKVAKQSLNDARVKDRTAQEELLEQGARIVDLEQTEMDVRNSLENLFGDMVSLARVYVAKEKEVASLHDRYKANIQELESRSKREQERNAQLEAQDQQRQYEYSILSRRYQRAKEKLEQEREDHRRKHEAEQPRYKRTGPISYINQLHTSSTSAIAATDRTVIPPKSNNEAGKENGSSSYSYSNGSVNSSRQQQGGGPLSRR